MRHDFYGGLFTKSCLLSANRFQKEAARIALLSGMVHSCQQSQRQVIGDNDMPQLERQCLTCVFHLYEKWTTQHAVTPVWCCLHM